MSVIEDRQVEIHNEIDAFSIVIDGNQQFRFLKDESLEELVEVFKELGVMNVTYEEVY